ncbi:hypothetical protein BAP_720 [Bacillus sp. CN2]|nr:hypothetical protein BAP_720 [Bacillus sp. CN2]
MMNTKWTCKHSDAARAAHLSANKGRNQNTRFNHSKEIY